MRGKIPVRSCGGLLLYPIVGTRSACVISMRSKHNHLCFDVSKSCARSYVGWPSLPQSGSKYHVLRGVLTTAGRALQVGVRNYEGKGFWIATMVLHFSQD